MWGLEIRVGQAADTAAQVHWLVGQSVSIGRPAKVQAAGGVDIVVQGDSAVSKVHAVLLQEEHTLSIKDLSRYGTLVNGEKMQLEAVRALNEGDSVKLASKVFIKIVRKPITICLSAGASLSADLQEHASAIDAEVVHQWQDGVTHVLATEGQQASSVLARALLTGTPVVTRAWIARMLQQKVWTSWDLAALEQACQPETLSMPETSSIAGSIQTVPLGACFGGKDSNTTLLQDFIIFFVNSFQDDCLAYCLKTLGAYMPEAAPSVSASHSTLCCSDAVQFVHCEDQANLLPHMPASELLACLLLADISPIQQRLINADLLSRPSPCLHVPAARAVEEYVSGHDVTAAHVPDEPQEEEPHEDLVHRDEDVGHVPVKSVEPAATLAKPARKETGEPSGAREAEFKKNRRPGGGAAAARKTGPGHAVLWLPLVTLPREGPGPQGSSGSAGGGRANPSMPNFKRFSKSRPAEGAVSQTQEATQVKPFPVMVVDPAPSFSPEVEPRDNRAHGQKRNADSLFEEVQKDKGKKRKQ